MTPEYHRRVSELFAAARRRSEVERAQFLVDACAGDESLRRDVERWLRQDASPSPILQSAGLNENVGRLAAEVLDSSTDESITFPKTIGRYRIESRLAQGGMGVVYIAEQDAPRRRVALKVIRPGMASRQMLRRFEQEAQVLGQLQHPGIAQIHDAGIAAVTADDGHTVQQPYFAMEFVDGKPIDDYANEKSLSTRQRLELLARVCDAVNHAHQKGVVHRDLKPSNILVVDESASGSSASIGLRQSARFRLTETVGQPKILDFGVARVTNADLQTVTMQTDVGQLVGTIPYMSPEQVSGHPDDLDTRSDVYALGAVLFELLTGKLPHDLNGRTIPEAARIIREEEPSRLSEISTTFRGDVETIVATALEKDKERRYASASDLASDIRRYLRNEPIVARPASAAYHFRKFVTRHKALVAGLAMTFTAMLIGLVVSTRLYYEADNARASEIAQRRTAEREAGKARAINDFILNRMLESSNPYKKYDRDVKVAQVLDDAAAEAHDAFANDPEQEGAVRHTLGVTYMGLGLLDKGAEQLRLAVDIRHKLHDEDDPDLADSLLQYAVALNRQSRLKEAETAAREALAMLRQRYDESRPQIADGANSLGRILINEERLDEAEPLIKEGLKIRRAFYGENHVLVALSLNQLGALYHARGDYAGAEPLLRESLNICRNLGEDHPRLGQCLNDLAADLKAQGKYAEAEPLFREALAINRRHLGNQHYKTLAVMRSLADTLRKESKLDEAESLLRETLDTSLRVLGESNRDTLIAMNTLALLLHKEGKLDEAEPMYRRAIKVSKKLLGPNHRDTLTAMYNLAWLDRWRHEPEEAEPLFKTVVDGFRKTLGEAHPTTITVLGGLAQCLVTEKKWKESESVCREALRLRRAHLPDGQEDIALTAGLLAMSLTQQGRDNEAEPMLRECLALHKTLYGSDDWRTAHVESKLGACLGRLNKDDEAERLLTSSYEELAANDDSPPKNRQSALDRLVAYYNDHHMPDESARYAALRKQAEDKANRTSAQVPSRD